jgi:hypothetical protein
MTKLELAKLVLSEEELNNIDVALPQSFVDDCMKIGIDPRFGFVWCYHDSIAGYPLDLMLKFYLKYHKNVWVPVEAKE